MYIEVEDIIQDRVDLNHLNVYAVASSGSELTVGSGRLQTDEHADS